MKIAIFGYNIFAPGGTTRSNINLIHEFINSSNYEVIYYNFTDFSKMDLITLKYEEPITKDIRIKSFSSIRAEGIEQADYYYITKESFYPIAKIIRSEFRDSIIIGEIHAPLDLIYTDLTDTLPYFSYIRVSTESIKTRFINRFKFNRVYSQNVSLNHIKPVNKIQEKKSNNFVIISRFDEQSKDLSYAIKLMDYVVNYLGYNDIHLYLKGYGVGETLYKNLINYYGINNNIHINIELPTDYTYLSSSRYETFGYSIIEALFSGHNVCLYGGNDGVVKENFKDFKMTSWLTKDLKVDGELIISLVNKIPDYKTFENDICELQKYKKDYVKTFEKNTSDTVTFDKHLLKKMSNSSKKKLLDEVNLTSSEDDLTEYRLLYYSVKKWPIIGNIISSNFIKDLSKNLITKFIDNSKKIEWQAVNNDYIFIECFHGNNFSGDPKYLALYIHERFPDKKIFVSSVNQLVDIEIRSYGLEAVRVGSKEYLKRFSECKYIILNGNSIDSAGKQTGQIFIQTWHGFPLKKMVNDLEDINERNSQFASFSPRMKKWDYLLTSSEFNTQLLSSAFSIKKNENLKIIEEGAPRNSYLLNNINSRDEFEKIHWKYFNRPYKEGKIFVLFCPTWRKNKRKEISNLDLVELVKELPDNYEIIVKLHPNESFLRRKYSSAHERIHCFYNELSDIQELYIISEFLISDYSSAIFDYAHLNRPIIVLQEDGQEYKKNIGWYFDIEKDFKIYTKSYEMNELVELIVNNQDDKEYTRLFTSKLLTKDSINSTDKILESIFEKE